MPKTSRINFEELKARADFRAVLAHYSLAPVGQGDQVKIRCPFHDDERPSCSVNLEKKLFHCFSCQLSGNVLDFVHRMEALQASDGSTVSLRQAGLRLAEICGVTRHVTAAENGTRTRAGGTSEAKAVPPTSPPHKASRARLEPRRATKAPEYNKPLGFTLSLDPAHPYLRERGLSPEIIDLFGLGFFAGEKGSMVGRVCIPIHNVSGELVAYAGRWALALEELPEGEEKYKLPLGFHKRLEFFNLHRVKHCKHLVVVEGFFAAMRLHSLRVPSVALMGSSISEEQVALLREHCPALRFVTVLLDGDEAGVEGGDKVTAALAKHWFVRIVALPDGNQPDMVDQGELERLLGRRPRGEQG